ncbi:MAG: hypothetical protein ACR2LM_05560 [Pyrinomonadaceae bacterium]
MSHLKSNYIYVVALLILAFAFPAVAQEKKKKGDKGAAAGTAVLWREPVDIGSRNLLIGAGGESMKPDLRESHLLRRRRAAIPRNSV